MLSDNFVSRLRNRWAPRTQREAERVTFSNTQSSDEIELASRQTAQEISRLFPQLQDKKALNLGCGYGRVDFYLAPEVGHLYLVDISKEMLKLAKARLANFANVSYVHNDGAALSDIPSASIDLVYSMFVLQHNAKEAAFRYLLEFNRILVPGGALLLQFPYCESTWYREDFLYNAVHQEDRSNPARVRGYSLAETRWYLEKAGFSGISVEQDAEERIFSKNELLALAKKSSEVSCAALKERTMARRISQLKGEWR